MSVRPIAKATFQTALINAGSNVLAQGISAYRDQRPFNLDTKALLQFTTSAVIIAPLSFMWLGNLEFLFPGFGPEGREKITERKTQTEKNTQKEKQNQKEVKAKLNIRNTLAKVVIDQTLGAAWNTVLFIVTMGALRGEGYEMILEQIWDDFWPIMIAGFKLWPFVSLLNFTVVPAEQRLLVNSLFGVGWGVYLSLLAG